MSATQTVPAVVPVAPVVAVALVAHIAPVAHVAPVAPSHCPGRGPTKAHKNADFVLEMPENEDSEGQKSTKTSILCSKCPKTGVPDRKSAQKPRFCARNARKRGLRRPKKHKNLDFVLEMPENRGSRPQKRTKTPILCSKCPKTWVTEAKKAQKPRFCAREEGDWHQGERKLASGSIT